MPRKPTKVNDSSIQLLKQYVQKKSNLACSNFTDMQQLQFKVKKSTHEVLSIQTLNRFFGLIKNEFKPSVATLDILARYINFASFKEFELMQKTTEEAELHSEDRITLITSLFSSLEYNGRIERELLKVVKNVHLLIEKEPKLAKEIYPFMASIQFGRKYFFEEFVHIDSLNKHYGEGLKYFLMHSKDREPCLFAYNVLCLRYFLNGQEDLFNYYMQKVKSYSFEEIKTFKPAVIGRYYASLILSDFNYSNSSQINEALCLINEVRTINPDHLVFPIIEVAMAEALIMKEAYDIANVVLNHGDKWISGCGNLVTEDMKTQYELLRLYAGYFSGKVSLQKASALLLELQTKPVYFLSKDYYALLINNLYKEVLPKSFGKNSDRQIELLIAKTGFTYFSKKQDLMLNKKIS